MGALKANLTTSITPLIALASGWLLLEEAIQPVAIFGFAIILAGFAVLESRELWTHLARYRSLSR